MLPMGSESEQAPPGKPYDATGPQGWRLNQAGDSPGSEVKSCFQLGDKPTQNTLTSIGAPFHAISF